MSRLRGGRAGHVIVFVAGLLATAALVRHVDPLPIRSHNRVRYLDCAAQLPQVDVLFVGSSRFQQGIVPAVFDAAMGERGHAVRSYNFAVSGQRAHDTAETVEWVLDQRYAHLFHQRREAEASIMVYNSGEGTLIPLMLAIEAKYRGLKVFSLPSVGEDGQRRHIELGARGVPDEVPLALEELKRGVVEVGGTWEARAVA